MIKIFSTAIVTLNLDLDLSKVNSDIRHTCWRFVTNFMLIELVPCEKTQQASRTNRRTNQPTNKLAWSQYLLTELMSGYDENWQTADVWNVIETEDTWHKQHERQASSSMSITLSSSSIYSLVNVYQITVTISAQFRHNSKFISDH